MFGIFLKHVGDPRSQDPAFKKLYLSITPCLFNCFKNNKIQEYESTMHMQEKSKQRKLMIS